MQRREFIAGLGGAAVWPLAARAQQRPALPVVGFVNGGSADAFAGPLNAFRKGLGETGYVEGRNVTVEYHWLEGQYERLSALMADLVRRRVEVIVMPGGGTAAGLAAKAATATIPIVFGVGEDPVRMGLVASLNRPGGNLTGVNSLIAEAWPKLFDLIAKLLPNSRVFAILATGGTPQLNEERRQQAQPAADAIGRRLLYLTASTPQDIDEVFPALARQGVEALTVIASPLSYNRRDQLVALTARYSLPAIYAFRETVQAGGLMSYGINIDESSRLVGIYTGRILKGEKPADLPVLQPTKFEFVINLSTAKALGLTVPSDILSIADEVIE